ncbi:MAG TPA: mercury methylation corrinoid protein HgcA, partial [Verrucomicrobiae bacterium]|nr:mercury methylation corrinoid protein HgcA [Verrucomicrobiae bacterium]
MVYLENASWVAGSVSTPAGRVLKVASVLTFEDTLGSWKARWGINRMNYFVPPGLYCVGNPDSNSPVVASANYKMSFDSLRKELTGLSAWILVLDTKGINVWCAAGKGTFGTKEIINRINKVKLSTVVSHRIVILPQLGAPGIAAHEVVKHSGFKVVFGPVRARDLQAFIANGMKADREMRTVNFPFIDRLVLTPIELVSALKPTLMIFGILFVLNAIGLGHFGF